MSIKQYTNMILKIRPAVQKYGIPAVLWFIHVKATRPLEMSSKTQSPSSPCHTLVAPSNPWKASQGAIVAHRWLPPWQHNPLRRPARPPGTSQGAWNGHHEPIYICCKLQVSFIYLYIPYASRFEVKLSITLSPKLNFNRE